MPERLLELTCTVFLTAACQVPSSEYWCETITLCVFVKKINI